MTKKQIQEQIAFCDRVIEVGTNKVKEIAIGVMLVKHQRADLVKQLKKAKR